MTEYFRGSYLIKGRGYEIRKDTAGEWHFCRPDKRAVPRCGQRTDDTRDGCIDYVEGTGCVGNPAGAAAEAPRGVGETPAVYDASAAADIARSSRLISERIPFPVIAYHSVRYAPDPWVSGFSARS